MQRKKREREWGQSDGGGEKRDKSADGEMEQTGGEKRETDWSDVTVCFFTVFTKNLSLRSCMVTSSAGQPGGRFHTCMGFIALGHLGKSPK